jgi:16S rRNA (guanine527-N7)-methyltransferase
MFGLRLPQLCHHEGVNSEFEAWCSSAGLQLSTEQLAQFSEFEAALYLVNEVKNLTRVPRENAWRRHFADSLLFHDLIPSGVTVLDIGTGPGFPAWPLACARPDLQVTALDSNGKMLDFLRSQPLPNLTVVQTRVEDWSVREHFDVVTGRAIAPFAIQMELSSAPCRGGGLVIPMRTSQDEEAISFLRTGQLSLKLREVVSRELVGEELVRVFPVYEKTSKTMKKFPRRWAEIRQKPLDQFGRPKTPDLSGWLDTDEVQFSSVE